MTPNPILEELWKIREQLLADANGSLEVLAQQIREREAASGRTVKTPGATSRFQERPRIETGKVQKSD